jgi:uncharacterized damage-inducible protein DinB
MRLDPLSAGPETELLIQYLEFQRETVILKTEGLTREQMTMSHAPSTLTLGGILNHLALVEDSWAEVRFSGLPEREPWAGVDWTADPDWEFRTAAELAPDELRDRYRAAGDRTRELVLRTCSLDELSASSRSDGQKFSLRWMLLHLIEETARHAGHADLIREAIDGTVGE